MARSLRRRARFGSGHHPVWLSVAYGLAVVSLSAHSLVAEARGESPASNPLGQVVSPQPLPDEAARSDGVPIPSAYVGRINFTRTLGSESQGIDLVLLVDTSASGVDQFRNVQHVAITLLGQLSPDDRVELVNFDTRVDIVEPFTSDHARVEQAIGRMRTGGSTSLYNALSISLRQLVETRSDASPDARLQAIVLLSDGEDTSSLIGLDEVLALAKQSNVAIYSIAIPRDRRSRRSLREVIFVLEQLAEETGGQAFFPLPGDLEEAALQVAKALATIRP